MLIISYYLFQTWSLLPYYDCTLMCLYPIRLLCGCRQTGWAKERQWWWDRLLDWFCGNQWRNFWVCRAGAQVSELWTMAIPLLQINGCMSYERLVLNYCSHDLQHMSFKYESFFTLWNTLEKNCWMNRCSHLPQSRRTWTWLTEP